MVDRHPTPPAADDWTPVSTGGLCGVLAAIAVLLLFAASEGGWVPLLDGANLMIHEAGHPLFGLILGEDAMVYGGTVFQLLFPVAFAVHFWRQRHSASFALMVVWVCDNLFNIARYLADARAQELPLLGGEHDWTEILGRWGLLHADHAIANGIRLVAVAGLVAISLWLWQRRRVAS
jgi:hypothetical protein